MNEKISALALALLFGISLVFPAVAEEMSMEQITEFCEKAAADQDDPDSYFEKCIDEKTSGSSESNQAEKSD